MAHNLPKYPSSRESEGQGLRLGPDAGVSVQGPEKGLLLREYKEKLLVTVESGPHYSSVKELTHLMKLIYKETVCIRLQ